MFIGSGGSGRGLRHRDPQPVRRPSRSQEGDRGGEVGLRGAGQEGGAGQPAQPRRHHRPRQGVQLSTNLREVAQYPEKVPTRASPC